MTRLMSIIGLLFYNGPGMQAIYEQNKPTNSKRVTQSRTKHQKKKKDSNGSTSQPRITTQSEEMFAKPNNTNKK